MTKIIGIIPARYASVRFPGKVLADLNGKPMIQHVYERVSEANDISEILIATDNEKVKTVCEGFGANVLMTSPKHPSGTDRCREALDLSGLAADFVVNIQGDEPTIAPQLIDALTQRLIHKPSTEIATIAHPVQDTKELFDSNAVKIAVAESGEALYFSRQAIPFQRDVPKEKWLEKEDVYFRHVGIYAYASSVLRKLTEMQPSPLEKHEALEQLRWLEAGYRIQVVTSLFRSQGVDTPEDLEGLKRRLKN